MTVVIDTIPEKYYLGFKYGNDYDPTDPPLAFITPWGADKAFEKRKATVDEWCHTFIRHEGTGEFWEYNPDADGNVKKIEKTRQIYADGPKYEIENSWREGFRFSAVRSRYSTDNKVYQIEDPLGFIVEVYSDNLGELLLDGEIKDGLIIGPHCWGRLNNKPYLLKKDGLVHRAYVDREAKIAAKKSDGKIEVGDLFNTDIMSKDHSIYIGDYYYIEIDFVQTNSTYRWTYSNIKPWVNTYKFEVTKSDKPWKISVYVPSYPGHPWIHEVRNFPKKAFKTGRDEDLLNDIRADLEASILGGKPVYPWGSFKNTERKNPYECGRMKIWFDSKKALREWVAAQEADGYAEIKQAWKDAHPPNDSFSSKLEEDKE